MDLDNVRNPVALATWVARRFDTDLLDIEDRVEAAIFVYHKAVKRHKKTRNGGTTLVSFVTCCMEHAVISEIRRAKTRARFTKSVDEGRGGPRKISLYEDITQEKFLAPDLWTVARETLHAHAVVVEESAKALHVYRGAPHYYPIFVTRFGLEDSFTFQLRSLRAVGERIGVQADSSVVPGALSVGIWEVLRKDEVFAGRSPEFRALLRGIRELEDLTETIVSIALPDSLEYLPPPPPPRATEV